MFGSIIPRFDSHLCSVEEVDGEVGGGGGGGEESESEEGKPKTFTQAEVNQIASKEKKEGRRSALADLMKEVGVESPDELREIVAAAKKAEDEATSEIERNRAKAVKEAAEAEEAKREAAKDRRLARLERRLTVAGVPEDKISRALKNLEIDADEDFEDEEATSAIEDLKKELPSLFQKEEVGGANGTKPPAPRAPAGQGKASAAEKARAQLEAMHPELVKKD